MELTVQVGARERYLANAFDGHFWETTWIRAEVRGRFFISFDLSDDEM